MAVSDCVVIWGTNPVNTQVNVMTHATKARKQRGAKIVAIDIYQNDTMKQADMAPLDVTGHGTLDERLAAGHEIGEDERALMARAKAENAVIVVQVTPFFGDDQDNGEDG